MYTIGQISKMVNITANALRYYDEIALLKPIKQDHMTGYRYYSDSQIKELIKIQELKYYGFSLNEIKDLLHADQDQLYKALSTKMQSLRQAYMNDGIRLKIIMKKMGKLDMDKNKLIMLVECVSLERMIMSEILHAQGFTNIIYCVNGQEAVEQYEKHMPHLVITGITMPVMDGLYASKLIMQKHNDARFIFCTYMSQLHILYDAVSSGCCVDFIAKPFGVERLVNSVIHAFEEDQAEINIKNIGVLAYEINHGNDAYKNQLNLNQNEIDIFLGYIKKEAASDLNELKLYLQALSDRYTRIKDVASENTDAEICYKNLGQFITLQKEANHRLIAALRHKNTISIMATEFVWSGTIASYILPTNNLLFEIRNESTWIGGFSFPSDIDFDMDSFTICIKDLVNEVFGIVEIEIKNTSSLDLSENESFILSTFMDDQNKLYNLFFRKNAYPYQEI